MPILIRRRVNVRFSLLFFFFAPVRLTPRFPFSPDGLGARRSLMIPGALNGAGDGPFIREAGRLA
jgi:hypothetical protein